MAAVAALLVGGLLLGFFATLSGACPLRQHVLAGQGRVGAWSFLAGFYLAGDRLHELDLAAHRLLGRMSTAQRRASTSTTQRPPGRSLPASSEAIEEFLATAGGNVGRAGHRRSIASSRSVSLARERLADLLGAETPDQVIFTKNATEGLNLAILGLVARRLAGR